MSSQPANFGDFRKYLPDLNSPRFRPLKGQDAHKHARDFLSERNPPWLHSLYLHWLDLLQEPFRGVTCDNVIRQNIYGLRDEGVEIERIVHAMESFTSGLEDSQAKAMMYHIDSPEWRTWSNPEILLSNKGVRLDELHPAQRDAALSVLKASLSPEGYEKAIAAIEINHFLGELVDARAVMNRHSYNLAVFGIPSVDRPWGFSFYGHHLCLNLFFYRRQIVVAPWFTGAEPNEIDAGPRRGTTILKREADLGLRLMQSLSGAEKAVARIYEEMRDPAMPEGRWNKDDQRHLCGAYRDNRVVPYEGIVVTELSGAQKDLVAQICGEYLLYLPETARRLKLADIIEHFYETYFSWIGGFDENDAFYYRIQSPVIVIEFDHHSGVFLSNEQPEKFHIHTILRYPNGGDYGHALKQHIPSKGA